METTNFHPENSIDGQNIEKELKPTQPLFINPEGKTYLIITARWSNFIAIVGFVMITLFLLSGIGIIIISTVVNEYQDFQALQYSPFSLSILGAIYIIYAVIYYLPCHYLYLFSKKIKLGMIYDSQESMNEGLKNLKKMAKFVGIVTIISLAVLLLAIPILFISMGVVQAVSEGGMVI